MTLALSQPRPFGLRVRWQPRSPMAGILFHLWLRLRWVTLGMLGTVTAAAVAIRLVPADMVQKLLPPIMLVLYLYLMLSLIMPLTYGGKDLAARESTFPQYMMVLPVRTRTLVAVPMLCAAGLTAGTWMLVQKLILQPEMVPQAMRWLMVAAIGAILWMQAMSWLPFWFSMLRVIVGAIVISLIITLGLCGLGERWFDLPWRWLFAGYLGCVAAAYPAAVAGVARARRGDGTRPAWLIAGARPDAGFRPRRPFRSLMAAQVWYEFRRNALILPFFALIAPILFMLLTPLMQLDPIPWYVPPVYPALVLIGIAFYAPAFFSGIHSTSMGKSDFWAKPTTVSSFLAVRPISSARLIAAKIYAAGLAVLVSYGLVLLLFLGWSVIPNSFQAGTTIAHYLIAHFTLRWTAYVVAGLLLLMLGAWKSAIQNMFASAFGRPWFAVATNVWGIFNFVVLIVMGYWLMRSAAFRHVAWVSLPYVIGGMIVLNVATAVLVFYFLRLANVISRAHVLWMTCAWIAGAGLLALALLKSPFAEAASRPLLILCAIAFFPVAKIALAPLALHYNRHR